MGYGGRGLGGWWGGHCYLAGQLTQLTPNERFFFFPFPERILAEESLDCTACLGLY